MWAVAWRDSPSRGRSSLVPVPARNAAFVVPGCTVTCAIEKADRPGHSGRGAGPGSSGLATGEAASSATPVPPAAQPAARAPTSAPVTAAAPRRDGGPGGAAVHPVAQQLLPSCSRRHPVRRQSRRSPQVTWSCRSVAGRSPVVPTLAPVVQTVAPVVQTVTTPVAQTVAPVVQTVATPVVQPVAPVVQTVAPVVQAVAEPVAQSVAPVVQPSLRSCRPLRRRSLTVGAERRVGGADRCEAESCEAATFVVRTVLAVAGFSSASGGIVPTPGRHKFEQRSIRAAITAALGGQAAVPAEDRGGGWRLRCPRPRRRDARADSATRAPQSGAATPPLRMVNDRFDATRRTGPVDRRHGRGGRVGSRPPAHGTFDRLGSLSQRRIAAGAARRS